MNIFGNIGLIIILGLIAIVGFVLLRQNKKTYKQNLDILRQIKLSEQKYEKKLLNLTKRQKITKEKQLDSDQNWVSLQIHKLEIQDLEQQLPFLLAGIAPKTPVRVIVDSSGRVLLDTGEVSNEKDKLLVKLFELNGEGMVRTTVYGPENIPDTVMDNLNNIANSVEEASKKYYHIVTDPMTNIYNRWGITNKLRTEVRRSFRFGHTLSLLMLDLDKFKQVNDLYGHAAGDEVLYQVAEILSENTREVDIVGRNVVHAENLSSPISQNVVGRFGERGDEFVILLPETDLAGATKLAKDVLEKIDKHDFVVNIQEQPERIHITASIGIATHPDMAIDETELLAKADAALYLSKKKDPAKGHKITVAKKTEGPKTPI